MILNWKKFFVGVTGFCVVCFVFFPLFAQVTFRARHFKPVLGSRTQNKNQGKFLDTKSSITVDGRGRTYIVHLPTTYDKSNRHAVVFVLHGGGGNAENAMRMSGMSSLADKEGFIVVYPNGTGRAKDRLLTWNTDNCCGYALENNVDDVKFIRRLIEELKRTYTVDENRVYFTGISNGAMMSYKIGCNLSDTVAAIAPVAGPLNCFCAPSDPVSVIIIHGTEDNHAPYNGGLPTKSRKPRVDRPVSYALDFWRRNNGCSVIVKNEKFGNIIHDSYGDCDAGSAVELYTIKGQGHAWPGGKNGLSYGSVDIPSDEISATETIWEFFKQHPKR